MTFRDEDDVDRPTVAGLLVFATEPTEFLASASIEAACYGSTRLSSDDLVHAERLAGPVSDRIDAGIAARFMQPSPDKGPNTGTVPAYDLAGISHRFTAADTDLPNPTLAAQAFYFSLR